MRARGEQGFTLILVLWGLVALSVIAVALTTEARHSAQLARARVGEAKAALIANAGIQRALIDINAPPGSGDWPENGTPVRWRFDGGHLAISIQDEAGKIDALNAPDLLITNALELAGLDHARADQVLHELRAARSKATLEGAFVHIASLEDLTSITSLTPAEIRRLHGVMTVRSGIAGIDPLVASRATLGIIPGTDPVKVADYLADRAQVLARADIPDRPASPERAFTQTSPRTAFTIRVEACSSGGYLAVRQALVQRTAPGRFITYEVREPLDATLIGTCVPASRKS